MGNNERNTSYYSTLKGFRRAVPIILATLAVLIGASLLSSGAGALGGPIRSFFMGLFSVGAYAIPFVMIVHAIFYASDVVNKKLGARLGFSITAVLAVSVIDYAISFSSSDAIFAPMEFYAGCYAGGFVGGIIGFALTALFGFIGAIVVCLAILAIYATFYFADKTGAYGQAAKNFASGLASVLTKVDDKINDANEKARQIKEDQEQLQREITSEYLVDDDFFAPKGEADEVKINLKSNEDPVIKIAQEDTVTAKKTEKTVDLSYGLNDFSAPESNKADTAVNEQYSNQFLGLDDSPENVFTKDFDPFNFATSERIASKPSSKTPAVEEELDDMALYELRSNHVPTEREKRMMELERRKKEWLEKKNGGKTVAEVKESDTKANVATAEKSEDSVSDADAVLHKTKPVSVDPSPASQLVKTAERAPVKTFETGIPESVNTYTSYTTTKTTYTAPIDSFNFEDGNANQGDDAENVAILISQKIAQSNPGYVRSANEMKTFTKVTTSSADEFFGAPVTTVSQPDVAEVNINSQSPVEIDFESEATVNTEIPVTTVQASEISQVINFDSDVQSYSNTEMEFGVENSDEPNAEAAVTNEASNKAQYERAAEFAAIMAGFNGNTATPEIKEYAAPVAPTQTPIPQREENTLKVERSMLSPTPDVITVNVPANEEEQVDSVHTEEAIVADEEVYVEEKETEEVSFIEEAPAVSSDADDIQWTEETADAVDEVIFDEAEEEPDFEESDEDEDAVEAEAEEVIDAEEIPPEEQNPDVIKMREMFPFLTPIDERKPEPVKEDMVEEEDEADEEVPPFDQPTTVKSEVPEALTGLVAVSDLKEEKKKNKPDYSDYKFPPIELLAKEESAYDDTIQAEIQENADKLIDTLGSFGVVASIKGVDRGPRITRYEVVPAKGVKVSSILNLQDDIALNLAAGSIRMEAPIPGKSAVGIEIPNKKSTIVRLRDLLETEDFVTSKSKTFVCIGRDVAGQPVFGDISKMPHLLIAGATNMGKSVCINSLLVSVLYKARPDEVKFIMIDPKQVEFTMYNGIPHLLVPVVSDPKQAAGALMWAVEEMERRYNLLNPLCVRNIDAYNEKVTADPSLGEPMSRIVIVIDEFADLMLQVKDPVENLVMRIAQKARAAGIYLVIGTQRPSVNVITGVIKANMPSRLSCKVMSNVDSKTVLDSAGAEKLLDKGDALYAPAGSPKPHRVQCAFVSDGEVESIMAHLKQYGSGANYDANVMEEIERAAQKCSKKGGSADRDDDDVEVSGEGYLNDRQFLDAVEVAVNTRKISTSLIQRKLSIGYGKAAKFIDIMEDMGIVGESNGSRPREVLLTPDEWREKLARATLD